MEGKVAGSITIYVTNCMCNYGQGGNLPIVTSFLYLHFMHTGVISFTVDMLLYIVGPGSWQHRLIYLEPHIRGSR